VFGSLAIQWIAKDIHFFSGCHLFGLKAEGDEDNHILSIFA
jgi:hypothetical protein